MAPQKRIGLVQVKLRISSELKHRLDKEAKKREDGSLSAEIAERLEQSFAFPSLEKSLEKTVTTAMADQLPSLEKAVATAVADQLFRVVGSYTFEKEDKP